MPFARIAVVAVVPVLLALAGCGHAPPPSPPSPSPAAVPRGAISAPESPERRADVDAGSGSAGLDRFVAAVRRKLPDVALDRRDEEVEDLGEQACAALGRGHGRTAAAGVLSARGVPTAAARTLVGLAESTLCRS